MEQFGLTDLAEAFDRPGGVHEVWNLLSLEPNLHANFARLDLWFDRIDLVRYSETCQPSQLTECAVGPLQNLRVEKSRREIHPPQLFWVQNSCRWRPYGCRVHFTISGSAAA